ncbi:MAG TPA: hypothetical protein VE404_05960, partial [Verrucomicrobiae bacterium]|nr:hypothetical protein [Verrucomicrobiae bacterium]
MVDSRRLGAAWLLVAIAASMTARADAPPVDAVKGIVAAFDRHPVVVIGEAHQLHEAGDFYVRLVKAPSFQALAPDIVVEFASRQSQPILDRYVAGDDVPSEEARRIWRDTTKVAAWESPIYAAWLGAIREVNRGLPPGKRLRVLAGDTAIDWSRITSHEEWAALGDNNVSFADVIVREVLDRERRALVVLGANHVTRAGDRHGGENTTTRLEAKHPGATFVALIHGVASPWEVLTLPDGAPPSLLPAPAAVRESADAILFLGNRDDLDWAPPLAGTLESAYLAEIDRRSRIEWGELRMSDATRPAAYPELPWREGETSPRLARLERDVKGGDSAAAARFWSETTAPLVEPLAEKGRLLVTFLHRGGAAVLSAQLATTRDRPQLLPLPGTDVWFRTFALRDDMRLSYTIGDEPER